MPALAVDTGVDPIFEGGIATRAQGWATLALAVALCDPGVLKRSRWSRQQTEPPTRVDLVEAAECEFTLRETCELLDIWSVAALRYWRMKLTLGLM